MWRLSVVSKAQIRAFSQSAAVISFISRQLRRNAAQSFPKDGTPPRTPIRIALRKPTPSQDRSGFGWSHNHAHGRVMLRTEVDHQQENRAKMQAGSCRHGIRGMRKSIAVERRGSGRSPVRSRISAFLEKGLYRLMNKCPLHRRQRLAPLPARLLHAADYIRNPCLPDIPATHQEGRVHICPLI